MAWQGTAWHGRVMYGMGEPRLRVGNAVRDGDGHDGHTSSVAWTRGG